MAPRNAVVITVDRLGAGYLGPYGNTWIETPAMNRLASQGVLFENAIGDTPQLEAVLGSYWQGLHAACRTAPAAANSLAALLAESNVATALVTDSSLVAEHPLARDFGPHYGVTPEAPPRAAESVHETRQARVFANAVDRLHDLPTPFLLWVHAAAMQAAWDAPYSFRRQFADEDDPAPPDFAEPPDVVLGDHYDPDLVLGMAQAYAGEIVSLDLCLSALLDALEESPRADDTLLLVTSPRGYALGEHGCVGASGDQLFGEILQLPLLARLPDLAGAALRLPTLVQPPDMYATLLDWFGLPATAPPPGRSLLELVGDDPWRRDLALSLAPDQRAVRTPIWFLNRDSDGRCRLFVKPDDRWEVNEVADRCQPVVEQLSATLDQFEQSADPALFLATTQLFDELLRELD